MELIFTVRHWKLYNFPPYLFIFFNHWIFKPISNYVRGNNMKMKYSNRYHCEIPVEWDNMTAKEQITYLAEATGRCYRCEICTMSRSLGCDGAREYFSE